MTPEEFAQARRDLTAALIAALLALWNALPSWHRENVDGFLADALPLVRAAQRTLADLVAVKVSDNAEAALGRRVDAPLLDDEDVTDLRHGVDPEDVYTRPFIDVWTALRDGLELDEAVHRGGFRLEGIAEFDMQQAHSEATAKAQKALKKADQPVWWERTLQGEESCALCVVASTQVYSTGDLNPIHPGCDCGIQEHWTPPPAGVLHPDRLAEAYDALRDDKGNTTTRAELLREVLTRHDELGQLLTRPRKSSAT